MRLHLIISLITYFTEAKFLHEEPKFLHEILVLEVLLKYKSVRVNL